MTPIFLVLSILLPLLSPIPYIRSILRGEAKPHRTTRLVILSTTSISTLSLLAQSDQTAIWLSAVSTIQAIVIFSLSLRFGMGGWTTRDRICLVVAAIGILLWKSTDDPTIALYFSILADFIGMVPTIIKTYKQPETELWYFFAIDTLAGIFNILAIPQLTVQTITFPLYIALINGIAALLALRNVQTKTI